MRTPLNLSAIALLFAIQPVPTHAQESQDWIQITDPAELTSFLSGKSLGNEEYTDFYRSDGAMAYHNRDYDTIVVRKWVVKDNGQVCTYIYVKPDKLVECTTFARSIEHPDRYQMVFLGKNFVAKGQFYEEPPQLLVDAVNEKAGSVK